MKFSQVFLSLFLIATTYFAHAQQTDPTKAPKTNLVVTINGKEYKMSEGQQVLRDGNLISVKFADYKIFDNGSIRFEYPRHFSFEYESDIGYKNWSFNGNNFVIMYFEIASGTLNEFVKEISGQFGKGNYTIKRTTKALGNRVLGGRRIDVKLVGEKLVLELFEIEMQDGKTRILAFQDAPDEYGNPTQEGKKAVRSIQNTISYKN
ncbi:MAG: hypothetical protein AAF617_03705 [Bacteroidota bacterium]